MITAIVMKVSVAGVTAILANTSVAGGIANGIRDCVTHIKGRRLQWVNVKAEGLDSARGGFSLLMSFYWAVASRDL